MGSLVHRYEVMKFEHEGKSYSVHLTWLINFGKVLSPPVVDLIIYHKRSGGDVTLPVNSTMLRIVRRRINARTEAMRALGCDDF